MDNGYPSQTRRCCKNTFYFGYKIDNIRYDRLKLGRTIQCKPSNDVLIKSFKSFKIDLFFEQIENAFLQLLRVWVGCLQVEIVCKFSCSLGGMISRRNALLCRSLGLLSPRCVKSVPAQCPQRRDTSQVLGESRRDNLLYPVNHSNQCC